MRRRWINRGHGQNIVITWPAVLSNKLSLCHHCHSADGAFNPRDPLVHTISLSVLTRGEQRRTRSHRASVTEWDETIDYIICVSLVQCHVLVDWIAATKVNPEYFV